MSNICEGITKSGVRCKNRTLHESKRCRFHQSDNVQPAQPVSKRTYKKKQAPQILSEQGSDKMECCVCLEEMPASDKLDCSHPVCRGCVNQLRNDKCPMCRRDISARHITSRQTSNMRQRFQQDRIARHLAPALAPVQAQVLAHPVQANQLYYAFYFHQ